MIDEDSSLFGDSAGLACVFIRRADDPNRRTYLGRHLKQDEQAASNSGRLTGEDDTAPAISYAKLIEKLLDKNSCQAQTQIKTGAPIPK